MLPALKFVRSADSLYFSRAPGEISPVPHGKSAAFIGQAKIKAGCDSNPTPTEALLPRSVLLDERDADLPLFVSFVHQIKTGGRRAKSFSTVRLEARCYRGNRSTSPSMRCHSRHPRLPKREEAFLALGDLAGLFGFVAQREGNLQIPLLTLSRSRKRAVGSSLAGVDSRRPAGSVF